MDEVLILFFKLGMDDLPRGVAFFSAVNIDWVLCKEVDLPCVTPSLPDPITPGESLNIIQILEKTNGGWLWSDSRPMPPEVATSSSDAPAVGCTSPGYLVHQASSAEFLRAQAMSEFGEVKRLAEMHSGKRYTGDIGGYRKSRRKPLVPS